MKMKSKTKDNRNYILMDLMGVALVLMETTMVSAGLYW